MTTSVPQLPRWTSGHEIFNRWLRDLFRRPELYWHYDRLALGLIGVGRKHYGSKGVYVTMRYHRTIEGHDETGVRISNDYTAWYSRLWTLMNPKHRGFFKFRPLKSFTRPPSKPWHVNRQYQTTEPIIDALRPEANADILEALRSLARYLMDWERRNGAS